MEIPTICRRKKGKSIAVSPEFVKALEQTCNWKKAERLPNDSFLDLFIGYDVLKSMESPDNQIIWGRRGTGKTHLLKAFVQKINDDESCRCLAFYVSCDNISVDSPIGASFNSDNEKMKTYARNTFVCFLKNLVEQMINTYEDLLLWKDFYKEYEEDIKIALKNDVDSQLYDLLENCSFEIPIAMDKEKLVIDSNFQEIKKEKKASLETSAQMHFPLNFITLFKGKFDKEKNDTDKISTSNEMKTINKYGFSVAKTRTILEKLIDALNIEMLYICIDELWLIDQKRELSLQPLFLEYIRQAFLSSPKISVKIASIREVTKFSTKSIAENNYGLQSGHDILELVNLDTRYLTKKERISHYKDILFKRINYFINKNCTQAEEMSVISIDYIIDAVFKNESNLDSLITLTHIIPRNFLVVLQRALTLLKYDVQHYFVHQYLIKKVVIKTYLEDKRASLPLNDNSLFSALNSYIDKTNNYFFLLKSDQIRQFSGEINNLIYTEIIHQIPSSVLPHKYMDSYKGFYIDSGKFLHTLSSNGDNNSSYEFDFVLPKTIKNKIDEYIIELNNIESNFVECENCSSQISKNHPVYQKAKICPICAFDLKS